MGGVFGRKEKAEDPEALSGRASEASTVAEGLRILAPLKAATDEPGQVHYCIGLTNLTARANPEEAEQILGELTGMPPYLTREGPRQHHAKALTHAAKTLARDRLQAGIGVADLIARIPGYETSPELQIAHGKALAQVGLATQLPARLAEIAQFITQIPDFERIGDIQCEYAKLLSNLVAFTEDCEEAKRALGSLEQLTGFRQLEQLQEVHARAERNFAKKFPGGPQLRVHVTPADVPDPGPDARVWMARVQVVDPKGGPVFFRDESENAVLFVRASDEAQARTNTVTAYQAMLEQGGHTVQGDVVDGNLQLRLVSLALQ